MFYISKIVWGLLQPSVLIGFLLAAGLILAVLGRRKACLRSLAGGAALYLIFGFSPLANWLLIPLEQRAFSGFTVDIANPAAIIVLGGAIVEGSRLGRGEPRLNDAAERMTAAIELAERYPNVPVVFTGGKAELFESDARSEAELARRFFAEFKIEPPRLKLEDRSRNTLENAIFTAKLLEPKPGQTFILITSAFHMSRARALFEAQGFRVAPWPVDFRTDGEADRWCFFPQGWRGLRLLDFAAKEWIGLLVAWMRGDIAWPHAPQHLPSASR